MNKDSIFDLSNIPEVWGIAKLDKIAKNERDAIKRGPFGSAIKKSFFVSTGYKVYEQKNVIYNDFKNGSYYISDEKFNELESFKVKAGDILMSCSGTVGRLAIVPSDFEAGIINQALLKITLNNNIIYTRFFFYLFGFNISRILQKNTRGSAMLYISSVRDLKNIHFPIPPLPEQHRIIAKIEELFTKLDAGVEALKQVQAQLKRYRQSVLKAAVEGRFTVEWREQNKNELEPADKLLKRILKERREKWEVEQSAKYEAQGKIPPKNWKNKYKEPTPPNTTDLAALPEGWVWCTCDQLTIKIVDGTHHTPKYTEQGIPFISVKNVRNDKIYFNACKYISEEEHIKLIKRCFPQKSDVIITKSGTIGRTAVIDSHQEFSLFVSVALLKRCSEAIYSKYLKLFLDGYIQSINIQQIVKGGLIKNLHLEDLRIVPLRLAPEREQKEIVRKVDQLYSIIERMDSLIESELKRAQSLRQSILKRAFEGKLVPQDPNDEPASVLLERIKAGKAKPKKSKQMEMF